MPGTYRAQGIVLRRTKLGETDLIVTLLCDRPAQVRAVAKAARKPGSRMAGVVDLGNEVSLLLYEGRNGLDIITDGTLVTSRCGLAADIERSMMAAAVLDCAADLTAEGEHDPRLLPLTSTALDAVAAAPLARLALVGAAYVFKAAAMQGYRPALDVCVRCGEPIDLARAAACGDTMLLVLDEGGVVCSACADRGAGMPVDAVLLAWVQTLLQMRFSELVAMDAPPGESELGLHVLKLAQAWLGHYPGIRPRALGFVLGEGGW